MRQSVYSLKLFAAVTVLLLFFGVLPARADDLQVSFSAKSFSSPYLNESISGSFIWDTATDAISQVTLSSVGELIFLPQITYVAFGTDPPSAPPYPTPSIVVLDFSDGKGDIFQLNYLDLWPDPPLPPAPGSYTGTAAAPFFIGTISAADTSIVVTAIPEPSSLLLIAFGLSAVLVVYWSSRASSRSPDLCKV
jgi:hypothetical protein